MNCACTHADDREVLMLRIQQTDFLLVDLQLYLDNHPDCAAALEDFNQLSAVSGELKSAYQAQYGPLMNYGADASGARWTWTDEPWPWERKGR
jgi:spore coat protein JB